MQPRSRHERGSPRSRKMSRCLSELAAPCPELAGVARARPGPVRDQPTRATPPRWKTRGGDPGVLGERRLSRLTPPRPSGGAPNAAAALGCLGRPFAATRSPAAHEPAPVKSLRKLFVAGRFSEQTRRHEDLTKKI